MAYRLFALFLLTLTTTGGFGARTPGTQCALKLNTRVVRGERVVVSGELVANLREGKVKLINWSGEPVVLLEAAANAQRVGLCKYVSYFLKQTP